MTPTDLLAALCLALRVATCALVCWGVVRMLLFVLLAWEIL
jgi:hypothetical protein